MQVSDIAKICHEANRALCETQGDTSQQAFESAEQWQRDSAIKGVDFALANPDAPASAQHDAWLADKQADGWKYGAEKNAETKEHHCMVPYDQLPAAQQAKDHLFKGIVAALAPYVTPAEEAAKEAA